MTHRCSLEMSVCSVVAVDIQKSVGNVLRGKAHDYLNMFTTLYIHQKMTQRVAVITKQSLSRLSTLGCISALKTHD